MRGVDQSYSAHDICDPLHGGTAEMSTHPRHLAQATVAMGFGVDGAIDSAWLARPSFSMNGEAASGSESPTHPSAVSFII